MNSQPRARADLVAERGAANLAGERARVPDLSRRLSADPRARHRAPVRSLCQQIRARRDGSGCRRLRDGAATPCSSPRRVAAIAARARPKAHPRARCWPRIQRKPATWSSRTTASCRTWIPLRPTSAASRGGRSAASPWQPRRHVCLAPPPCLSASGRCSQVPSPVAGEGQDEGRRPGCVGVPSSCPSPHGRPRGETWEWRPPLKENPAEVAVLRRRGRGPFAWHLAAASAQDHSTFT